MNPRPAFFLDRDGTLIEEREYLHRIQDVCLLPGAAEAVRRINRSGSAAVVVTNQSGVARNLFSLEDVARVNDFLDGVLQRQGARIDSFYYCPHHPEGSLPQFSVTCQCRKPAPGMLLRAARELELDLTRSVILGDTLRDIEAGRRAGCRGVLVRTGYGIEQEALLIHGDGQLEARPDFVANGMLDGVQWVLENPIEPTPE